MKSYFILALAILTIIAVTEAFELYSPEEQKEYYEYLVKTYYHDFACLNYTTSHGFFLTAKKTIPAGEVFFSFPVKLSNLAYENFPFKKQFFEFLQEHPSFPLFSKSQFLMGIVMQSLRFMLELYTDRNVVLEYLQTTGDTEEYIFEDPGEDFRNMFKFFPRRNYNVYEFKNEEIQYLHKISRQPYFNHMDIEELFYFLKGKVMKFPFNKLLQPMFEDYEQFFVIYTTLCAHAIQLELSEWGIYRKLKKNTENYKINLAFKEGVPFIAPTFPLLKHIHTYRKDFIGLEFVMRADMLDFSFTREIEEGEKIGYMKSKNPSNAFLLEQKGMIVEENEYDEVKIMLDEERYTSLSPDGKTICEIIECIDGWNKEKNLLIYNLKHPSQINPLNNKLLNLLRVEILELANSTVYKHQLMANYRNLGFIDPFHEVGVLHKYVAIIDQAIFPEVDNILEEIKEQLQITNKQIAPFRNIDNKWNIEILDPIVKKKLSLLYARQVLTIAETHKKIAMTNMFKFISLSFRAKLYDASIIDGRPPDTLIPGLRKLVEKQ